jgi:hypothetical protein
MVVATLLRKSDSTPPQSYLHPIRRLIRGAHWRVLCKARLRLRDCQLQDMEFAASGKQGDSSFH